MKFSGAALLILVACESAGPVPMVIPIPAVLPLVVMCAPAVDHGRASAVALALDADLFPLVESRGYSPIPVEVSQRLLEMIGWSFDQPELGPDRLTALQDKFGIDAVLATEVVRWISAGGQPVRYEFEIRWRLINTADGGLLWNYAGIGLTGERTELRIRGPVASDEPGVGAKGEQFLFDVGMAEADDVVGSLQRGAILRLPIRTR